MTMFQRKRIKEIAEGIGAKLESRADSLLMRLVQSEKTWLIFLGAVVVIVVLA